MSSTNIVVGCYVETNSGAIGQVKWGGGGGGGGGGSEGLE
jgi:hypothetical protein